MKLREDALLKLPPDLLWPWLADPSRWPQWNRKMKEVRRTGTGPVKHGETFTVVAAMSRTQVMQAEVMLLKPSRRLVVRCRYEWRNRWRGVTEDWELIPQDGGTLVRHISDLGDAGIPILARWVIWFIQRFGRPVEGSSPWNALERMVRADGKISPG